VAGKQMILGVDYADDVETAFERGQIGDTPLIEQIMQDAASAGMTAVCWRVSHIGRLTYRTLLGTPIRGMGSIRESLTPFGLIMQRIDPLEVAIRAAHQQGLKLYVYYTLFDECYTDPGTGLISESRLGQQHPEFYLKHAWTEARVRGVMSLGYPEVRDHFAALVDEALQYGPDGIYLDCARTHSGANCIPVHGWYPQWTHPYLAYGYNEPDVARYRETYGEDPPMPDYVNTSSLAETEREMQWNQVRGGALTELLRQIRPAIQQSGVPLCVTFFPSTYNGFNPGCHCRQMLGRFRIDWRAWCDEQLVDAIRLNVDHRRFGYDDWQAVSAAKYEYAQDRGVQVYIDCAIDSGRYDQLENLPRPLPIRKDEDPDTYFDLMRDMTAKMLKSSADGLFFYEHCGNDDRTWRALAEAAQTV